MWTCEESALLLNRGIRNAEGHMVEAEQVTEDGFLHHFLNKGVILSVSVHLPALFSLEATAKMESFSSDSGQSVLWAKIDLMNKAYSV